MELRREKSKAVITRRPSRDLFTEEAISNSTNIQSNTTPVRSINRSEDEESPYFPCSTQEMREDVDVLWDYNSPQSRPKTTILRKSKKKLNLQQSPKVPFRRHASNNNEQIKQDFCKLREELKALKAEIAKPDNEESLILSPNEEEVFKRTQKAAEEHHIATFDHLEFHPNFESDAEDPFDDGMEDQLILCSQQIEIEIQTNKVGLYKEDASNSVNENNVREVPKKSPSNFWLDQATNTDLPKKVINTCSSNPQARKVISNKSNSSTSLNVLKNTMRNSSTKTTLTTNSPKISKLQDNDAFNDSFDNVLSQMNEDDFNQLTQVVDIKQYKNYNVKCDTDKRSKVFPRSLSEDIVNFGNVQSAGGKVEWHRTQSFESYNNGELTKEKLEQIEKKRLKAKAKLEAKKKADIIMTTIPEKPNIIPKCFAEEIEKKRLQALAKLEAKRQQEIIEKKKQEALRRLMESRKKNAALVKSSLATRL